MLALLQGLCPAEVLWWWCSRPSDKEPYAGSDSKQQAPVSPCTLASLLSCCAAGHCTSGQKRQRRCCNSTAAECWIRAWGGAQLIQLPSRLHSAACTCRAAQSCRAATRHAKTPPRTRLVCANQLAGCLHTACWRVAEGWMPQRCHACHKRCNACSACDNGGHTALVLHDHHEQHSLYKMWQSGRLWA